MITNMNMGTKRLEREVVDRLGTTKNETYVNPFLAGRIYQRILEIPNPNAVFRERLSEAGVPQSDLNLSLSELVEPSRPYAKAIRILSAEVGKQYGNGRLTKRDMKGLRPQRLVDFPLFMVGEVGDFEPDETLGGCVIHHRTLDEKLRIYADDMFELAVNGRIRFTNIYSSNNASYCATEEQLYNFFELRP